MAAIAVSSMKDEFNGTFGNVHFRVFFYRVTRSSRKRSIASSAASSASSGEETKPRASAMAQRHSASADGATGGRSTRRACDRSKRDGPGWRDGGRKEGVGWKVCRCDEGYGSLKRHVEGFDAWTLGQKHSPGLDLGGSVPRW